MLHWYQHHFINFLSSQMFAFCTSAKKPVKPLFWKILSWEILGFIVIAPTFFLLHIATKYIWVIWNFWRFYPNIYGVLNVHCYSTIQLVPYILDTLNHFYILMRIFQRNEMGLRPVYEAIISCTNMISIIVFEVKRMMTAWFKWYLYYNFKDRLNS